MTLPYTPGLRVSFDPDTQQFTPTGSKFGLDGVVDCDRRPLAGAEVNALREARVAETGSMASPAPENAAAAPAMKIERTGAEVRGPASPARYVYRSSGG